MWQWRTYTMRRMGHAMAGMNWGTIMSPDQPDLTYMRWVDVMCCGVGRPAPLHDKAAEHCEAVIEVLGAGVLLDQGQQL
jgi:hypothetical protein